MMAENVGRSKYHQIFYDQMLGPVGRRGGQRHLGRSRRRHASRRPKLPTRCSRPGSALRQLTGATDRRVPSRGSSAAQPCRQTRRRPMPRAPESSEPRRHGALDWRRRLRGPAAAAAGAGRRAAVPAAGAAAVHAVRRAADGRGRPGTASSLERLRQRRRSSSAGATSSCCSTTPTFRTALTNNLLIIVVSLRCSCRSRSALAVLLADRAARHQRPSG